MIHRTLPASLALPLLAVAASALPQDGADPLEAARTLFVAHCATCHGETGDGQGVTQLDRPARSFQDGGFSFGNTPEALFRTISTGIPGTPMPGFDSSLTEEQRVLLADYVVTLGPPVEHVATADMVLEVHDRPLVVRGLLPAIADGLDVRPRGLLVGDPSGITFEYRIDDVRLLGLRLGGFVERSDWTGRGGTALKPLGSVVHLVEGGNPEPTFLADGAPLVARMKGTRVGDVATLEYGLSDGTDERARVVETPSVVTTALGTGYERRFRFLETAGGLQLRSPAFPGGELVANGTWDPQGVPAERYFVVRQPEGPYVYVGFSPGKDVARISESPLRFGGELAAAECALTVVVLTDFGPDTVKQLEQWREAR